jgi:hypothetical protein
VTEISQTLPRVSARQINIWGPIDPARIRIDLRRPKTESFESLHAAEINLKPCRIYKRLQNDIEKCKISSLQAAAHDELRHREMIDDDQTFQQYRLN